MSSSDPVTVIHVASPTFAAGLVPLLQERLGGSIDVRVVKFESAVAGMLHLSVDLTKKDIDALKDARVLITDNLFFGKLIYQLPQIEWIQGTFAGVDIAINHDLTGDTIKTRGVPTFPVTRFTGNSYGSLMFEYCLSFIISNERGFRNHILNQATRDWEAMKSVTPAKYRLISELTVTILGVGSIGAVVANLFKSAGCRRIKGYSKSAKTEQYLSEHGITSFSTRLEDVISDTDYIVSILPDTPGTRGLLNSQVLSNCNKSRKTVLINLGRGSLIKEEELIKSLDEGFLSLAVLDVFEQEPLPSESRFWTHPRVALTPHISAETRPEDLVEVFMSNWSKFNSGQILDHLVNWNHGY